MTRERIELTGQDESTGSGATRRNSVARTIHLADDAEKTPDGAIDGGVLQDDTLQNEDARFLRTEKRVPVRRSPIARKTASRLKSVLVLALVMAVAGGLTAVAYAYAHAGLFIIASSDNIEVTGLRNTSRTEVMEVAGDDIGRSVLFVPLQQRRTQLEKLPWVESATVMRLLPDRIAIHLVERTPVAFVQIGAKIHLIDAVGVILGSPANRQARYSFPVIRGIADSEPLSARAAAMKIYNRLVGELASGNYTQQLSEVDLSDPEDVKATVSDAGGTVLLHLGASDFLERYKLYAAHIGEWRQQFAKVQSVDMRYEGQIVVNPDTQKSGDRVNGLSPQHAKIGRAGDPGSSGDLPITPKPGETGTPRNRGIAVNPASSKSQKPAAKGQKPGAKSKKQKARRQ